MNVLVNGRHEAISPLDRGLAYGDGLFETILFVQGRAPLWHRHLQRLSEGCGRLAIPAPDTAMLAGECERVVRGIARAVVRITLTRGVGERGYAYPTAIAPTRIVAAFPAPDVPRDWSEQGIRVRFCATRLADQPALAGLKHLNRLEQVLARAEWSDAAIVEGLMLDHSNHVIGATAANVFARIAGRWATPALDRCGVAGVMRAEILAQVHDIDVRDIGVDDFMQADEVFLTNSVRGVIPVSALDERHLAVGPTAQRLIAHWQSLTGAT